MNLLKRLCTEESGQGLTEYTLIMVLVVLVFWLGVKDTDVGGAMATSWSKVSACLATPFSCGG